MATLMEKDVLLEYAHIGHLLPKEKTAQTRQDSIAMGALWEQIIMTDPQDLDFNEMVQKIKALRSKYEEDTDTNEAK